MTGPAATVPPRLTRFQRVLLGTDGTITHILEAYTDEPIEVVKLRQVADIDGDVRLGVPAGEDVLRRQVLVRTGVSKRNLLYAEADVAIGRVDPVVLRGLLATDKPIGTLLAESRTEVFREVLAVSREPAGRYAIHFGIDPAADLIGRTYRIVAGRQPVMVITEKLPAMFFQDRLG